MFCDNNIAAKNMESQNAKSWKINEIKFIKPTEQTQIINFDRIIKNLEHLLSNIFNGACTVQERKDLIVPSPGGELIGTDNVPKFR